MVSLDRNRRLVEQALQGDGHAFGELMAPYNRRLYLVIMRIVGNRSDADDVMQESLLCAYRGLPAFRADAAFFTWLYRIASNCALACLAQRRRLAPEQDACAADCDAEPGAAPPCDDPEQVFAGTQLLATIGMALDSMHPEYRTAIVLREIDGLSYHEIADAMVCPIGTVRSRIANARSAIGSSLKQNGYACGSVGA